MGKIYYLMTRLERDDEARYVHGLMRGRGWECTYDWTTHGSVKETSFERLAEVAVAELNGACDAQIGICLLPGGRGTHVEIGASLASGVPIVVHGPPELFGLTKATTTFYHHPLIHHAKSLDEIPEVAEALLRE